MPQPRFPYVVYGAWGLIAVQVLALLGAAWIQPLGADEFEHLHFAWLVGQGEVPYRDFFEHHHPLLWYLLAPFTHASQGLDVAFHARLFCVVFACATAFAVGGIVSELRSRVAGAWAAAAWLSLSPVQACAYQVRPDPLMVACLAFSLWLLLRRGNGSAFLSGLCWAVGFAFLQKAVLFLPVLALVLVRELWVAPPSGRRAVLRRVGFCALGASVPIAVGALALAAMQAGGAWWQWAVLFNRTTPPLEGTWFLRGLWPWRKAVVQTNTLAFLLAAGAALWIAWRGRSLERWILLSGTAILLCLQMLPRRPYYVYSLPSSLALAGLVGIGLALSLERVRGERKRLLLGLGLAAALAAPTLPAFLRAWEARGELEYQAARSRHVLERMRPSDVLFQGYPPFAIQARDAGFLGWMPLEMGLRAHSVGLDCGPDAETVLRARRPAFVGLGTAHLPLREERARLAAVLTEELGYVWNQRWQLYEREEWLTAERLETIGGAPGSVRVPAR